MKLYWPYFKSYNSKIISLTKLDKAYVPEQTSSFIKPEESKPPQTENPH